ncbi:MAG: hypothetical protein HC904_01695 [Blastochloris sp.]|nr:hypothetical protein [Blastochloris sp.]
MAHLISSHGWNHNLHLSNSRVELLITLDVGPRILRFAPLGGPNIFKEFPAQLGQHGEADWMIRGGHRLWVAPEADYCYTPDNAPLSHQILAPNHVVVTSTVNEASGWHTEMEVRLLSDRDEVQLCNRVRALRDLDLDIAPWALSVMAPGGTAILPQPPLGSHPEHLLPNRRLILWPYTEWNDPRFSFGRPNLLVRQDAERGPTKFGLLHRESWVAYQLGSLLFAKTIAYQDGANYPDLGVNFELFTNREILELESLAPLVRLKKGECAEHHETWVLQQVGHLDWNQTSLLDVLT